MKVGDRVKVVKDAGYIADSLQIGSVGTIVRVKEHEYEIQMDSDPYPGTEENKWPFDEEELEVIQ